MTLGELRRSLGVTQVEMAKRTGFAQENISRIERSSNPTLSTIARYLEALGAELEVTARVNGEPVTLRF